MTQTAQMMIVELRPAALRRGQIIADQLLAVLQRAHRRDGLEVIMEARDAHSEFARDIVDSERLVRVFAQTDDSP